MEKKLFVMVAAIMMATASANAQEAKTVDAYFTADEMPDMRLFMPGPPDSTSVAFANDVTTILEEFEEAFGLKVSQEDTPEIYKVLLEGTATCDSICKYPKALYGRTRPFVRFNEHTLAPEEYEGELNPHKSFPSGHTLLGWSSALLMMEINPDRANEILARGYRYGENRVVVGAHWQSDTDAARMVAAVAYAKLHTSERFLEQMKKAREEFKQITSDPTAVREVQAVRQSGDAEIYDLSGRRLNSPGQGVYIQDGQKRVAK